ncbi:MAG: antibiotic biosynthesis monooxygenase [Candidatus Marinimicrobia bacterium]|nr:antibiotic biosynthesis monooxygenase [Candidatus Neomarinimicrobiota bacterium]
MIIRSWKGATKKSDAEEYYEYLLETGIKEYQETEGNQGVYVLRKDDGDRTEFILLSLWDSFKSIRSFAGSEPEKAVFYPEDEEYLIDFDKEVTHFDVLYSSKQ